MRGAPDWVTEPAQTFPSPRVLRDWPPGAHGVVEYRCPAHSEHVFVVASPDPCQVFGDLRGLIFGDVTCPACEEQRTGWIPPMRLHSIWWDTAQRPMRAEQVLTIRPVAS